MQDKHHRKENHKVEKPQESQKLRHTNSRPLFSSSGNFLRMRVIYTAYSTAEQRLRMSPRIGFKLIPLSPISESPKLTMIVPPMQSSTPMSFTQLNFSPKKARESRKVKGELCQKPKWAYQQADFCYPSASPMPLSIQLVIRTFIDLTSIEKSFVFLFAVDMRTQTT
ncbi:hypothetical protein Cgig2_010975 [Carnegiea gigantea]|uniref:Uncharacterized protein n=1 Tax=Carnegiea gigantea TaxID=171969 RepID=A0A9Q1GR53_9CARY|nr:hypothetical protein Cgig2_010975 [Carnegiea gigantea]